MKKVFGHIYLFDTSSPYLGRSVADKDFINALLRYGTFDEYHFFFDDMSHQQVFINTYEKAIIDSGKPQRVKLYHIAHLEQMLATTPYTVFHTSDPMIDKLLTMRNMFNTYEPFAVTGYTHTLSPRFLLPGHVMTLLNKPAPYDAILCSSESGKLVMEKIYSKTAENIKINYGIDASFKGQMIHQPIGINLERFGNISKEEARKKTNIPADAQVILSLARLTPSSKMDYFPLLDVFSFIARQRPNTYLLLAGGIPQDKTNYLKELQHHAALRGIQNRVLFAANFEDELKPFIYSAADIFVSPSDNIQETFGITILEAMASGLPVVCSDWDGYKELVKDGETGFKVKTIGQSENDIYDKLSLFSMNVPFLMAQHTAVDYEIMADRLLRLLQDKALMELLSANAREEVEKFDWKNLIPEYESTWVTLKEQALANHNKTQTTSISLPYDFVFSHYATEHISDETQIEITSKGQLLLQDKLELSISTAIMPFMQIPVISTALKDLSNGGKKISHLKNTLSMYKGALIERHMLWLLKHGYVKTVFL